MDLKSAKAKELSKTEVLREIRTYLEQQLRLSTRKCYDEDNFTLPSWSEFQAYQLGIQKAYTKLLTLIPDQGE